MFSAGTAPSSSLLRGRRRQSLILSNASRRLLQGSEKHRRKQAQWREANRSPFDEELSSLEDVEERETSVAECLQNQMASEVSISERRQMAVSLDDDDNDDNDDGEYKDEDGNRHKYGKNKPEIDIMMDKKRKPSRIGTTVVPARSVFVANFASTHSHDIVSVSSATGSDEEQLTVTVPPSQHVTTLRFHRLNENSDKKRQYFAGRVSLPTDDEMMEKPQPRTMTNLSRTVSFASDTGKCLYFNLTFSKSLPF